jgi:hypothetical protein
LYVVAERGREGFVYEPRFEHTAPWDELQVIDVDRSEIVVVSTPAVGRNARLTVTPGLLQIKYIWPSSVCDTRGNWVAIFQIKLLGGDGKRYRVYWNDIPVDFKVKVEEPDVVVIERPGDIGRLVGTVRVESGEQSVSKVTDVVKVCNKK